MTALCVDEVELADYDTACYANGPAVVTWLDSKGITGHSQATKRAVNRWRHGDKADVWNLDAILVRTIYNLHDLPEGVWLLGAPPCPKRGPRPDFALLGNRRWLARRYVHQCRSTAEIAREVGCDMRTVRNALDRHGIARRSKGTRFPQLQDADWLEERYHGDGQSLRDIAAALGCSRESVQSAMRRHGITTRKAGRRPVAA